MRRTHRVAIELVVLIIAVMMLGDVVPRARAQQALRQQGRDVASIDVALQQPNASLQSADEADKRLREGTTFVEQAGTFKAAGDRVLFRVDGRNDSLHVLENLALERIWNMLADTRGRQWSVSGTVTEYRGRNFLLIQRAVLCNITYDTAAP